MARESPGERNYESKTGMKGTPHAPESPRDGTKCAECVWAHEQSGKLEAQLESRGPSLPSTPVPVKCFIIRPGGRTGSPLPPTPDLAPRGGEGNSDEGRRQG